MLCLPLPSCSLLLQSNGKVVGYAVLTGIANEVDLQTGTFTLNSIMTIGFSVSTSSALRYDGMPQPSMHAGCHSTGSSSCCLRTCPHAPCQLTWQSRPPTKPDLTAPA